MVKTFGSVDKKKRKKRSDFGKRRKYYRGKKTKPKRNKSGKFRPYIPPYEKKQNIKIWFWERLPMNPDSYYRFNKNARGKIRKVIFKFRHRVDVPISMINTKEKLLAFCEEQLWAGEFYVMGFSRGRTRTHIKPVTLCVIYISETSEGLRARLIQNRRLFRYSWFKS